jgi:hypothetical protein
MDSLMDYTGPPTCGHCSYPIMPHDPTDSSYKRNNVDPNEGAPHGWVHDPSSVDWKNHYCHGKECGNNHISHHSAYPSDGASPEVHEHAANKFLEAANTKLEFDKIMRGNNMMPNNPNINFRQFGEGH